LVVNVRAGAAVPTRNRERFVGDLAEPLESFQVAVQPRVAAFAAESARLNVSRYVPAAAGGGNVSTLVSAGDSVLWGVTARTDASPFPAVVTLLYFVTVLLIASEGNVVAELKTPSSVVKLALMSESHGVVPCAGVFSPRLGVGMAYLKNVRFRRPIP